MASTKRLIALLKSAQRNEEGFALPLSLIALAIGSLLIPVFMEGISTHHIAYRVYSTSMAQEYSCGAGVKDAVWNLQNGQLSVPEFTINGDTVNVTIEDQGGGLYKITSIATGNDGTSTTIEARVSISGGGPSIFDYAAVSTDGNVRLDNSANIHSIPAGGGDIYANGGNVDLNNTSQVDGDTTATGTIDVAGGASIGGTQTPGAATLSNLATQTNSIDAKILEWKAAAQNHDVDCSDIECGTRTWNSNAAWEPPPGSYGTVNIKRDMRISGSGNWTFSGTVCTGWNLYIEGDANVVFQGQVQTGRDLRISTDGSVVFQDKVCVGSSSTRDLLISGNGTIIFNGQVNIADVLQITQGVNVTFTETVKINDDVNISGAGRVTFQGPVKVTDNLQVTGSNGVITFEDSVFGDDLVIRNTKIVQLVGPSDYDIDRIGVYVTNQISLYDSAQLKGGQNIVAEDRIRLYNTSSINPEIVDADDIPFLVSTGDYVILYDNSTITALVYAPTNTIRLEGDNQLLGCAVSDNARLLGSNAEIEYLSGIKDRPDLQNLVGAGGGSSADTISWK